MNNPVVSSLIPVVLIILAGFVAGRRGWMGPGAIRELSNLVFGLFTPALLFRTMSKVQAQALDFGPVDAYFAAVLVLFAGTLAVAGFTRRGAVLGLACTFSNTIMVGIPIVGLAFGEAGLVTLFTLYSVHTVLLLTGATIVLELALVREQPATGARHSLPRAVATAVKNALLHPVPLPILLGLAYAQTGWGIPPLIDRPMELLGTAFGPLALVLVGLSLAHTQLAGNVRSALALVAAKNLLHPALVAGAGLLLGLSGLPLAVVVVIASLPAGANALLFSQRYGVAQDEVTTTVGLSTFAALITVPVVMTLARQFI